MSEVQGYLSKACGENVSLAEIYQLVLNRDLVISARFDAHEPALLGKYIRMLIPVFLYRSWYHKISMVSL